MYICPNCGAHLDSISEHCDCEDLPTLDNDSDYINQRFQEWFAS